MDGANKYKYYLTPLAEQDIDSALSYIVTNLCNTKAALDLLSEIEHAIDNVVTFPLSIPDCKIFLMTDENIRHTYVDNYCLIYEVKEASKQINILRFLYCKIDFTKLEVK